MSRWCWACLLLVGCRGLHEERVYERLIGRQLMQHEFALSLATLDAQLRAVRIDDDKECPLCLLSSQPTADGKQVYCLMSGIHTGCVLAQESRPGRVRLVAIERSLPPPLTQALWRYLEGLAADVAVSISDEMISSFTNGEEQDFAGAWSFFANVGSSAVVSLLNPAFGFSAQGGVRRWLNYYLIGGAGLEFESLPFTARPFSLVGLQARAELSMWDERFRRAFNLPGVTFVMTITPLAAFGSKPAFGARAMIGAQMLHLGSVWTPIRLEIGYQHLVVNGLSVSGARAGVQLGF